MKTSRDEVYAAIDGERDYQDSEWGTDSQSFEGELLLLTTYSARAGVEWSVHKGNAEALRMVRKIAGIAVRCMEHYGAPKR